MSENLVLIISDETCVLNIETDGPTPLLIIQDTGSKGADGLGVPAGGTTGQVLAKVSNANNDTEWTDRIKSDINDIAGADVVSNIVSLTQAEYNDIVSPDASTLYLIVG